MKQFSGLNLRTNILVFSAQRVKKGYTCFGGFEVLIICVKVYCKPLQTICSLIILNFIRYGQNQEYVTIHCT